MDFEPLDETSKLYHYVRIEVVSGLTYSMLAIRVQVNQNRLVV